MILDHSERLRQAVIAIKTLKAEIAALKTQGIEPQAQPIAVVGIGCRYPGANNPAEFWDLLRNGRDAIREVPSDRWDNDRFYDPDAQVAGKITSRYGGFLDDVDRFDPKFFRISPREAVNMDPQQRLLLEVCWEALEDGAQSPDELVGSRTGVFVGIASSDYSELLLERGAGEISSFVGVGNAHSVAVGRLAFFLGAQGPALAVDTACSSSLVAIHLAAQSLRSGECSMALAGGVNLILTPTVSINHSRAQMLALDGRCKTFDQAADGFSRAEGCGMVVLKRLSDAQAAGDHVLAVIHGSAVNHDGRTTGITVPNGRSQQGLIEQALAQSGLSAADIDYVEAHGTGTALGDPIELGALEAVFGKAAREHRLLVGSVKTNIGHAEAAAGVAGLLKVVLAMKHGEIPPHLHCKNRTDKIDWEAGPLEVRGTTVKVSGEWYAGVSSFGFGGTNAHLVLGTALLDDQDRAAEYDADCKILPLSAKSEGALRALAGRYADCIERNDLRLADVCYTAAVGRKHFNHRLALCATTATEMYAKLRAENLPMQVKKRAPKVAFLFTGQGAQSADMGRALYENESVFRGALERCAAAFAPYLDRPLLSVMYGDDQHLIDQTVYTQPALFSIEIALCEMWAAWGVIPDVVLGHSIGEMAAACMAGVFGLEDGARLVAARGRLMNDLPRTGAMLAVVAAESDIRPILPQGVEMAAVNGPSALTLSGDATAVALFAERLTQQRVRNVILPVSHAFHSYLMEPMLGEFRQVALGIQYHPAEIEIVSNVTGKLWEIRSHAAEVWADYWVDHARNAVRFADGMQVLEDMGVNLLVEIGPKPTLTTLGKRCWGESPAHWLPSLNPISRNGDLHDVRYGLSQLYLHGVDVDWRKGYEGKGGYHKVPLPTYPFQRQRYWVERVAEGRARKVAVRHERDTQVELGYYALGWERQDLPGGALVAPGAICETIRGGFKAAADTKEMGAYGQMLQQLDRLAADYVALAVQALGGSGVFSVADLQMKMAEIQRKRLPRLLALLARAGYVVALGDGRWETVPERWSAAGSETVALASVERAEFRLVHRCGENLPQILRGEADPLQILFPGGDMSEATAIYAQSAGAQLMNGTMGPALVAALGPWPRNRPLRVLEIGGGTGGATQYILPHLPAAQTTYTFTDISTALLARTQQKFSQYEFVDYRPLDIEKSPASQGFSGEQFDIVIAFNVMHATPELAQSMGHVRDMLAPSGMLFLLENTVAMDWVEVTWGLTEDWWLFRDFDLRPEQPLLSVDQWDSLLRTLGWDEVSYLQPDGEQLAKQALIIGKMGERGQVDADVNWLVAGDESDLRYAVSHALMSHVHAKRVSLLEGDADVPEAVSRVVFVAEPGKGLEASIQASKELLRLVQNLAGGAGSPKLWLLTSGGQFVDGSTPLDPLLAPLWGMGKTIALEHPEIWGGMLDVSGGQVEQAVAEMLAQPTNEDHIAYRPTGRFVARLREMPPASKGGKRAGVTAFGHYLITGGMGALGLHSAEWLVAQGGRRVTLMGRSQGSAAALERVERLRQHGVDISVVAADVSDVRALSAVIEQIKATGIPLRGVIHAAGLPGDCLLADLEGQLLEQAFAAKVAGGWHLHQLTADLPLDFFVCYGSMVGVWGAKRQAHYVAANHFLSLLAHYRQGQGLPALTINWGPLVETVANRPTGMFDAGLIDDLAQMGIGVTAFDGATDVLADWVGSAESQVIPVAIDWKRFKSIYELRGARPLLSGLGVMQVQSKVAAKGNGELKSAAVDSSRPQFRQVWAEIAIGERRAFLQRYIQKVVGEVLHFAPDDLPDSHQGFFDLGLDSLTAMELRSKLEIELGVSLPATLVFDFSTIALLTDHLMMGEALNSQYGTMAEINNEVGLQADLPHENVPNSLRSTRWSLEEVAKLDDAEVEALLIEYLNKR